MTGSTAPARAQSVKPKRRRPLPRPPRRLPPTPGTATACLVLGIISFAAIFFYVFNIPIAAASIICGVLAIRTIMEKDGHARGFAQVATGLFLSLTSLSFWSAIGIALVSFTGFSSMKTNNAALTTAIAGQQVTITKPLSVSTNLHDGTPQATEFDTNIELTVASWDADTAYTELQMYQGYVPQEELDGIYTAADSDRETLSSALSGMRPELEEHLIFWLGQIKPDQLQDPMVMKNAKVALRRHIRKKLKEDGVQLSEYAPEDPLDMVTIEFTFWEMYPVAPVETPPVNTTEEENTIQTTPLEDPAPEMP